MRREKKTCAHAARSALSGCHLRAPLFRRWKLLSPTGMMIPRMMLIWTTRRLAHRRSPHDSRPMRLGLVSSLSSGTQLPGPRAVWPWRRFTRADHRAAPGQSSIVVQHSRKTCGDTICIMHGDNEDSSRSRVEEGKIFKYQRFQLFSNHDHFAAISA